jgi:cysteine synthase
MEAIMQTIMQTGYVHQVIGKTPMIKIKSLSDLTGCEIYAKAEYLNPGGSVKDRAALGIINEAESKGLLKPGITIVEGTAGNTGIGLATIAAQKGYRCLIVMPNNQSQEKYDTLKAYNVELVTVAPCPFANENHFYHTAKRLAAENKNSFWADQFENKANFQSHFQTTGPEIWQQMDFKIDIFVSAVGTGGTIAGVSRFLKKSDPSVQVLLADPMGSGLFSFQKSKEFLATGSSITEGIGIMRLTANFKEAQVDQAMQVSDQQMISMLYHLAEHDGLLVGTSAALNVFAAYKHALEHKNSGKRIVTILCDSGLRYQSKIFNPTFLKEKGLKVEKLDLLGC